MEPVRHLQLTPTRITSRDFDRFVGEVAGEIWNTMVHQPPFHDLKPAHYADLFEAVSRALTPYHLQRNHSRKLTPR